MRTEVRHKGVELIFSATPSLETLRILLGVACQEDVFQVEDPMLITIADVSRAHFYADVVRDVYVRLPSEDTKTKQPGVCGTLRKTMYGSLDAAQRWGEHYAQVVEKGGCTRGVASPCHFFHKDLETYILVHGDDFFIVGRQEGREHVLRLLRSAYELSKVVTLGPLPSQSRTATILGRTLTLRQWGIEYEPDQQHVSRALKALGLTGAKGVGTPGTDDVGGPKASEISEMRKTAKWHNPPEEVSEEDDLLIGEELKLFQSVAARFNFLAMDRPDLLYSVKELMRKMASPRAQDLIALKRVARYTIKYPRMACRYPWTPLDSNIEVFGDANFAGTHCTRKSTVGGIAMWSGQFVKAWSKTMAVLALSSGESELAAGVRAATEGMGLQSILNDLCLCGHVAIKSDATAAIGMVHRLGLGKVRHLAVGDLWVQHHVHSGKIRVAKMSGLENPSDAQTKFLGPEPLLRYTKTSNWVPVVDDDKSR